MGKKKTRQEKKIADLHRRLTLGQPTVEKDAAEKPKHTTYTFTKPTTFHKSPPALHEYAYVTHDLLKTTYLTSGIVAAQLLLYFLLRMHVVKIPGMGW